MKRAIRATLMTLAFSGAVQAQEPPSFDGRYIAAISDGDMRAYAYIDGRLGAPRGPDELAIVGLPLTAQDLTSRLEVSNTVINPVYSIAAGLDGNTVFVAETHTTQEPGDTTLSDLHAGTTLRAIDVTDLAAPRVSGSVEVGNRPMGVSVSPDGRTLVLATKTPETPLTFVSFADGSFGEPKQFAFENLVEIPELPDQGMLPHHAEWHPSADIVAVTFALRNQVRFYRVERTPDGGVSGISQWGNPVITTKWPMSGKFSRDGQFFITNDLKWGPDVEGFYVNAPRSQLTSVRLGDLEAQEPRHTIVSGVEVPRHAESIAFSNTGDLIATLNIGQTWIAPDAPGHSLSSLSLVAFDLATGHLRHLGDWEMEGILPEGVAFDADDSHLVAGIFEYDGPEQRASALEFWQVKRQPGLDPRLVPTGFSIPTGPGAHSLIVVND
ncbi:MAG: hypothetical protein AAGC81_02150 [Pseudomonadota bacterium]